MASGRKKRRRGRPSKLTAASETKIIDALRAGASMEAAARLGGVGPRTLHRWLAAGESAKAGVQRDLWQKVRRARAEGEQQLLASVKAGGPGWQGAAWILERRWRDTYGKKLAEERRSEIELRRLEAEARIAEAKAALAAKGRTDGSLIVEGYDADGLPLSAGLSREDIQAATPTPLPSEEPGS
jgi:hypothetical protein